MIWVVTQFASAVHCYLDVGIGMVWAWLLAVNELLVNMS